MDTALTGNDGDQWQLATWNLLAGLDVYATRKRCLPFGGVPVTGFTATPR
jgi:hypothetical protein